jgi:hypothetical protein
MRFKNIEYALVMPGFVFLGKHRLIWLLQTLKAILPEI